MNRKEFFKKLGLGALVVAVAPKVMAEKEESHLFTQSRGNGHILSYKDAQLIADEDLKMRMQFPLTYNESWTFRDVNTGVIKIIRNGFYVIGDLLRLGGNIYQVHHCDNLFYYCYPL